VADFNFHPDYAKAEQDFEQKSERFWQQEKELREKVRSMVAASREEREEAYVQGYTSLLKEFEELHASTINAFHSKRVGEAEEVLFSAGSGRYADLVVSLATAPDERLRSLYEVARQSNQHDLLRAVAHTAKARGAEGLWREWVMSDEERANALRYIERTPDAERFADRTLVRNRPIKATREALEPTREARAAYAEEQRKKEERERERKKQRAQFFDKGPALPKRQVGSRFV
jgi:hypothetical protein